MNKAYYLIIFNILIILSQNLFAKNKIQYYQSVADSLYNIKDYKSAAKYYDSILLKEKKPNNDLCYNAARIYALAQNVDVSFKYLNKCIDLGYLEMSYLNNDDDLLNCRNDKRWNELIEKNKTNWSKLDTVLVKELLEIDFQDQSIRKKLFEYEQQQNKDSIGSLISKILEVDSINLVKVENIIQKNGWPSISKVGRNGNNTIWLVVQHNPKIQEKYYPLLKQSVRKGESSKTHLAYLEDRINAFIKNKKQKYGTQYNWNKTTDKNELWPLKYSIKRTNKLRAKLGLISIEENNKIFL